jgi:hypothetical protein
MTYDVGNAGPGLGQTQKCGWVNVQYDRMTSIIFMQKYLFSFYCYF